ncbi:MAG: hypothetical protein Q8Q33_03160 [Chlamydiota bacterium]|nr:hypothetical protein [Chlamydiota bacterium]
MATMIATTVALGAKAYLFLAHEALLDFVEEKIDQSPVGFQRPDVHEKYKHAIDMGKITAPSKLLKQSRELGSVSIYGCSESAKLFRLSSSNAKNLDGIIGYTTFQTMISGANWITI